LELALIISYSVIFLFLIRKSGLFDRSVLSTSFLTFFGVVKIAVALLYYYIVSTSTTHHDSRIFIRDANIIYSSLQESIWYYIHLTFGPNDYLPEPDHLCAYIDPMGFWYDQGNYTMVRINSIFRLFSFGYSSLHYIFFSMLSFVGAYNLYRFFERQTKVPSPYIALPILFFPGTLFWTSGGHKEAIVFLCIGLIFNMTARITEGNRRWSTLTCLGFAMLVLAQVRFYTLAIFLPGLIAYLLVYTRRWKPFVTFAAFYGTFIICALLFDINSDGFRIAEEITIRQQTFQKSDGNTSFDLPAVSDSWTRIFGLIPHAVMNPYCRPLISDCNHGLCLLGSIESMLLLLILFILIIRVKLTSILSNPNALLCISFGILIQLLIGLIVNNAGAIVRYRSVAVPLIIVGLLIAIHDSWPEQKNDRNSRATSN
jgi:hypothetical protein